MCAKYNKIEKKKHDISHVAAVAFNLVTRYNSDKRNGTFILLQTKTLTQK